MFARTLIFGLVVASLAACGTLQVGIETSPTAPPPGTAISSPATETSPPRPTQPAIPSPTVAAERVKFPVGSTNVTFATRLEAGAPKHYILQILANQKMTLTAGPNVTAEVLNPQNNPLKPTSAKPDQWQFAIPVTGDYVIVLSGNGLVTVSIDIPPPG